MTPLVGRDAEIALARGAVDQAVRGEGGLLLVTGEAGIGKTRLCREVGGLAAAAGAQVAWGRCWEVGGAPAYWPWIEVFRSLGSDPFTAEARADAASAEARFRLFDSAARALGAAAVDRPLVVILDDLHAADAPSLLFLLFVAREATRAARLLVVASAREVEVRASEEIGALISKIAREATPLPLGRLRPDDVVAWIGQGGAAVAGGATADDLFRITEGNPLFLEELLRVGARGAGLGPRSAPSDGIATVLDEHLARLSPEARPILELAAVLGRDVSAERVARAAGLSLDAVVAGLREAVRAGVLGESEPDRLAFSHVLLRDRLYQGLPPSRRAALHWQAGLRLTDAPGDAVPAAHHLLEGASSGDAALAARAALRAAERAGRQLAFETAASLCARALELPLGDADAELRADLERTHGEALIRAGRGAEGQDKCVRAVAIARRHGLSRALARAALAYAAEIATALVDPVMVGQLREALAALEPADDALRIRVMARLAAAISPPADPTEVTEIVRLGRSATEAARRLGDPETLLYTLQFTGAALGYMVPMEERAEIAAETARLARSLGAELILVRAGPYHAMCLFEQGRRVEAEAALAECLAGIDALPQANLRWRASAARASVAMLQGRFEEAEREGEVLRRAAESAPGPVTIAWALHRLGMAHVRGAPASIAPEAERLLAIFGRQPLLAPYAGWVLAATGRREEAAPLVRMVVERPYGYPWIVIASDAATLVGDAAMSASLYQALSTEAGAAHFFWGPGTVLGPTARILGDLARALGKDDEARGHYAAAIDLCRRIGAAPLVALAEQGLAALGERRPARAGATPSVTGAPRMRREGDVWAIEPPSGPAFRLKHAKGLAHLAVLLESPGREVHVLALLGAEHAPSDAGPVLDARAKHEYRARVEALEEELGEAERFGDPERARRAREELDLLAEQLAGAVGLGGRDRRAGSHVERARINVQRRLKDAIEAIRRADPALGRYLEATVRTGTTCSFTPV